MKTISIVFAILMSCSSAAQNFFPLALNNKYQVMDNYELIGPHGGSQTYIKHYEVIDDSIIDGKQFFKFSEMEAGPFLMDYYFHYDQTEKKILVKKPDDTIRVAVDFNVPAGEWFTSYIKGDARNYRSNGLTYINIFNDTVLTFKMNISSFPRNIYIFAENIGLFYYSDSTVSGLWMKIHEYDLLSGIVDTFKINPVELDITSLTPLANRPENTFPFSLQGSYYTNLKIGGTDLVDSFYTEVIQIRGKDTIGIFNYHFSLSNYASINLYPKAGDRLLIRAIITDTTIYNNFDTYPDSGYTEMLVLPVAVNVDDPVFPTQFFLQQNFPNPFNPVTTIQYTIPSQSFVTLAIYDLMGNEVIVPVNEEKPAGIYELKWNAADLTSGVYFCKLQAGSFIQIRKLILMK